MSDKKRRANTTPEKEKKRKLVEYKKKKDLDNKILNLISNENRLIILCYNNNTDYILKLIKQYPNLINNTALCNKCFCYLIPYKNMLLLEYFINYTTFEYILSIVYDICEKGDNNILELLIKKYDTGDTNIINNILIHSCVNNKLEIVTFIIQTYTSYIYDNEMLIYCACKCSILYSNNNILDYLINIKEPNWDVCFAYFIYDKDTYLDVFKKIALLNILINNGACITVDTVIYYFSKYSNELTLTDKNILFLQMIKSSGITWNCIFLQACRINNVVLAYYAIKRGANNFNETYSILIEDNIIIDEDLLNYINKYKMDQEDYDILCTIKQLNDTFKDLNIKYSDEFLCPISNNFMTEPVIFNGITVDKSSINTLNKFKIDKDISFKIIDYLKFLILSTHI